MDPESLLDRWPQAIANATRPLPGQGPYQGRRPIHVPLRFAGLSVLEFLRRRFPHVPASQWEDALGRGHMLWEGQRPVRDGDRVRGGTSLVHIKPGQREPEVNCNIAVLHVDESILVLAKPAPLPMHPCGRFCRNTLSHILSLAFPQLQTHIVHRLDADTSGVVVLARHKSAARELVRQFEARQVAKSYRVGVWGAVAQKSFVQAGDIDPGSSEAGSRRIVAEGRECSTRFVRLEQRSSRHALLQAYPSGGRTHQIRIHAACAGYPIVGDGAYGLRPQLERGFSRACFAESERGGSEMSGTGDGGVQIGEAAGDPAPSDGPPLMLHAQRLGFWHPESKAWVQYEAPLPAWARDAAERGSLRVRADSEGHRRSRSPCD